MYVALGFSKKPRKRQSPIWICNKFPWWSCVCHLSFHPTSYIHHLTFYKHHTFLPKSNTKSLQYWICVFSYAIHSSLISNTLWIPVMQSNKMSHWCSNLITQFSFVTCKNFFKALFYSKPYWICVWYGKFATDNNDKHANIEQHYGLQL